MAAFHPAFFQIALMVLFRPPKSGCGGNFRGYRPIEFLARLECFLQFVRGGLLLWRMKENSSAVLLAEIRPLPIDLSWIVQLEKNIEQLFVREVLRIKSNLHNFSMARCVCAYILVGRILHFSAAVTYGSFNHSRDATKSRFNSPKTPSAK